MIRVSQMSQMSHLLPAGPAFQLKAFRATLAFQAGPACHSGPAYPRLPVDQAGRANQGMAMEYPAPVCQQPTH